MTAVKQRALLLFLCALKSVRSDLVISEVAYSGTSNACNGEDWVELFNSGAAAVDMTGFILTDSKGFDNAEAEPFYFPSGFEIQAGVYLLMCGGTDIVTDANGTATLLPFPFGIGEDDTLQLLLVEPQPDGTTTVQTYSVVLLSGPPTNGVKDVTYAWDPTSGVYNYTATPTPGKSNVMTPIPTQGELALDKRIQMIAQNDEGIDFFNFNRQGMPVLNAMDPILILKITMDEGDHQTLERNSQFQEYVDFQQATVVTEDGVQLLTLTDPGRIRTRGMEETYMAACLGSPLPFRLDFDSTNETQTMFGVQRIFLRHSLFDPSHMRDWAYSRMLARFGLPHARTRMVQFYINDIHQGLYTLMEVPETEYVFARSFPDYDTNDFALFQTTPLTENCGLYSQNQLDSAYARVEEFSTPPYAFERGDHVKPVTKLGEDKMEECKDSYQEYFDEVLMEDVVLAYYRHDEDCADLFVGEGLLDQELGTDNWDKEIKDFVESYMASKRCDPDCANSDLANTVDVENWLKTFAFYAVVLNIESPIAGTNNFYLAQQSSTDKKWKLVSYDFDKPGSEGCNEDVCNARLVHWSITRPTCKSLEDNQLVGPLLSNPSLQSQYLEHVQGFLDTVYTNTEFIEEIKAQAIAIEDAVKSSFGGGASYADELSPDAASWDTGTFPLLPTMKARAEDLTKQLAALKDGSSPRGMNGTGGGEVWETCANWQLSEPDTSACGEGCKYDGCRMTGWTVEYFCDEGTGACYHGQQDQGCKGVADGDAHGGLDESSFCQFAAGIPTATSECPPVGAVGANDVTATDSSSTSSSSRSRFFQGSFCTFLFWQLLFAAVA